MLSVSANQLPLTRDNSANSVKDMYEHWDQQSSQMKYGQSQNSDQINRPSKTIEHQRTSQQSDGHARRPPLPRNAAFEHVQLRSAFSPDTDSSDDESDGEEGHACKNSGRFDASFALQMDRDRQTRSAPSGMS